MFIPTPSGRKRFNVLCALDALTKEVITITNEIYINSQVFCELLFKLALHNYNMEITIILDNARYQKCRLVKSLAEQLNINLLYLPSYSPNLNLIERLWRYVKKECLYSRYYEHFDDFKKAIINCLYDANSLNKNKIESLMSWKFHFVKKVQILGK